MSLTDEEFRVKLEKHFSLYRINLRSPIASCISPNQWYRVDILLVNEIGLFRRADILPNGQVIVYCELYKPNTNGITPLVDDDEWEIEVRSAPSFNEGCLSTQIQPCPGFYASGKGTFEYRVKSKCKNSKGGKRFLHVQPTQLINFAQKAQAETNLEIILPLVIGPIEIQTDLNHCEDTHLPLELWKNQTTDMVYDGYRVFSTSQDPPINIAIHEMWDSGIPGKIWDSALVMLDVIKNMIQYHPQYIHEKHTLDLSAGTGLLGLYIASMMATSTIKGEVTITELDEAVDLIDQNISINQYIKSKIITKSLLWGNKEQAKSCGKADLIIASDVLYEAQFFNDLVNSFVDLSHQETRIYIGYKRRGFDELEEKRFWDLCGQHFDIKLLTYQGTQDTDDVLVPHMTLETGVKLYRLTPL